MNPLRMRGRARALALAAALGAGMAWHGILSAQQPAAADRSARIPKSASRAAEPEAAKDAERERKLDRILSNQQTILANQQAILQRFNAVMEELRIIKVRTTLRAGSS